MYTYSNLIKNPEILNNYKSRELIPLKCSVCLIEYKNIKHNIQTAIFLKKMTNNYCSVSCRPSCQIKTSKKIFCDECNSQFEKQINQINKTNHNFCSRTCSTIYRNKNKTHGTRRSKLEIYLETKLQEMYPEINFTFNNREICSPLELDIYIPSLKLAFELNGIFHYEPIFGESKLGKIQENDNNKFQKCQEQKISLCIIDVSGQKKFTEKSSQKYLDIIVNIIKVKCC